MGVGQDLSSLTAGLPGAVEGAQPATVGSGATLKFSVYQNASTGYTYLDLSKFGIHLRRPLQLVIRTTLPSASFPCSGQAIPFCTAEYTNSSNGAGLMGPYVPLVDYYPIASLPATANTSSQNLPSAGNCGTIPNYSAQRNGSGSTISYPSSVVQWPTYWPSTAYPAPLSLACGTQSTATPTIRYVTTQWPFSTVASQQNPACTAAFANCTNVVSQSLPAGPPEVGEQTEGQPPLPITIVGDAFGFLPADLPFVPPSGSASSQYLEVQDVTAGWNTANNPACQVYIAN